MRGDLDGAAGLVQNIELPRLDDRLRRPLPRAPDGLAAGAASDTGDDMAFACTIPAVATVQQDDDAIRITRWDFEPGAVTGWHSHGWPYFVVMLVAGTLRIHDGTKETDVPLALGQAYMRPAGIEHDVMERLGPLDRVRRDRGQKAVRAQGTGTIMKIAVIGAGIVGAAIAHALLDEGHEVLLVDKEGPAFGPSRGNAGWIAHTDILPIASPKILRQVPKFLMDPLGPLSIRPAYLPKLLPWLARFVLAARPQAYERSIIGLGALQQRALPAWLARAQAAGLERHIHRNGGLYVFTDADAFAQAKVIAQRQAEFGIRVEMIGPEELKQFEPALKQRFVGAAFHPDTAHISDPLELTLALFEAALARSAVFEKAEVTNISLGERPALIGHDGWQRVVDRVVVAAGAWSKPLAAAMGDRVPLDTERGYNVSFPGVTGLTSRPVGFEGHGFVMTPLDSGLRIGGAVEFGGLDAPPNHARTKVLYDKAATLVDGLPAFESGRLWMGFRPSMPDSLPVIGASSRNRSVLYAFGHGHYGMTQSAATADLIAALIAGRTPQIDLEPFSPRRF